MGRREYRVHLLGTYDLEADTNCRAIQENNLGGWIRLMRQPHSIDWVDRSRGGCSAHSAQHARYLQGE
jgi:hypothetical protein